jgi:hypothetical protein
MSQRRGVVARSSRASKAGPCPMPFRWRESRSPRNAGRRPAGSEMPVPPRMQGWTSACRIAPRCRSTPVRATMPWWPVSSTRGSLRETFPQAMEQKPTVQPAGGSYCADGEETRGIPWVPGGRPRLCSEHNLSERPVAVDAGYSAFRALPS